MNVTTKQLNEALDLIIRYASDNLPSGWAIEITIERNDSLMELYGPSNKCESFGWYSEQRTIREMVDFANEHDQH